MSAKPDLIVFSQYLLGGGTSFHKNMLSNFPRDMFNIKCIYLNPLNWHGAKALDIKLDEDDVIFPYGEESDKEIAKRLSALIPDTEGVILSNLITELKTLDIYPKPRKTVFFICHDNGFIDMAIEFQTIIDVFIAHNFSVYQELIEKLDNRKSDVYFIQHGVNVPVYNNEVNKTEKLKIGFLARHHTFKGLYDLPIINEILLNKGVEVDWMILGDGPERNNIIEQTKNLGNFYFDIPQTSEDVISVLKKQDIFILPSRADGLPVALLESMSVGCVPVISNFSEGIKRVVSDDIGFVVPVGDNDQFAEAIEKLSHNRQLLQRLSENSIAKVKDEFNIKKQALEYYNLYSKFSSLKGYRKLTIRDVKRRLLYIDFFSNIAHFSKKVQQKLRIKKG